MTIKIDKQGGRQPFPLILPDRLKDLSESYVVRKGDIERVAGFDCQVIVLEPKDNLRYGQKLCAETVTGMLLKAKTFNEENDMLEAFTFTELKIGGHIGRDKVRTRYAAASKDWHVEDAGVTETDLAQAGWIVRSQPPGFRKVIEVTRLLREAQPVGQVVFSDGLAAVSVFIEPLAGRAETPPMGLASMGAVNVYTRQVANHLVTVVGETPAASVQRIGDTVTYRAPQ